MKNIFCSTLTAIAIVIDTMLTHTFPAYTLIAIFIFIGAFCMKKYEKHEIDKNNFMDKNQCK